jgi:undecaprenyl diphosphate synthase
MDGNGRWAAKKRRPRTFGHQAGVKSVRRTIEYCLTHSIPHLTLFAFSSENWQRPPQEVQRLMELFMRALEKEVPKLHENNVRLQFIGDLSRFSESLQQKMQNVARLTAANTALNLNIAINYGGRWDITQAARQLAEAVRHGKVAPDAIDEETFGRFVALDPGPDPDLLIRTGGEQRISNFLLWQLAYTELWFTETLWPDFGPAELDRAIADFQQRERRFGKIPTAHTHSA